MRASEVTSSVLAELFAELTAEFHIVTKSEHLVTWHPNFMLPAPVLT